MKYITLLLTLLIACTSCYQRRDPLVRAAQDLQQMADQFASQEDEKIQQFNSLRLGMSEDEVIKQLGAPVSRRALSTGGDENREQWTYRGAMSPLGTLTFVNKRLVEIRTD